MTGHIPAVTGKLATIQLLRMHAGEHDDSDDGTNRISRLRFGGVLMRDLYQSLVDW